MKPRDRLNWRNTSLLLLTLSMTSACVHGSTPPLVINNYCKVAEPIYYNSKVDSPDTVKQIEAHNRKLVCLCEGDCPKQSN